MTEVAAGQQGHMEFQGNQDKKVLSYSGEFFSIARFKRAYTLFLTLQVTLAQKVTKVK